MKATQNESLSVPLVQHASIELTYKCNLQCSHCYSESGPRVEESSPLSIDEHRRIIEDLYGIGCRSIQLIGGEPTLHARIVELLEVCSERGINTEIYSNLTRVSPALWACIKKCHVRLATSVYSFESEIHDRITGRRGSHAATMKNIRRASDEGIPVRVGFVEMEDNKGHAEQVKRLTRGSGAYSFRSDRARSLGRLAVNENASAPNVTELCGRCWDGKISISPEGILSPCVMSTAWAFASIRSTTFRELIATGAMEVVRAKMREQFAMQLRKGLQRCSPEDECDPGVCSPDIGGPEDCTPHTECAPYIFDDDDDD